MKYTLLFLLLMSITCRESRTIDRWSAASPGTPLQIILAHTEGKLYYTVLFERDTIVKPSRLGIKGSHTFADSLTYVASSSRKVEERYTLLSGKQLNNHAVYNETSVSFTNKYGNVIHIDLRAYDDGVAFRYRLTGDTSITTITGELTEFFIPAGRTWMQNYAMPSKYDPSYEYPYLNGIPVGTPADTISGWSFPALFNTSKHWLLITESNATKNYCGTHLRQLCDDGKYAIAFPLAGEAKNYGSVEVETALPLATPWRVIIAGKDPGVIVQSNLVHHLADSNKIGNTSWIKAGRSSWSWWSDHASSRDFTRLRKFVDLAKDFGWEYSLVDANWNNMQNGNIEQLISYATSKQIDLSLWYNSGGMHNDITEAPRYIMNDSNKRRDELKKLHNWGVKAIKVDFFQSDKQSMMQQYIGILEDAAKQHITVIFHGCTIPKGWSRTYPNLLSMEGIRGAEQYGWDTVIGRLGAQYNTINVFTRNVIGSMDYTPVTFSSYTCCPHTTTHAHELALSVLYESGMQHFADSDSSYRSQTAGVKNFLKRVPNTWDETRFISGEPGKEVMLARRKGDTWYIAGINGEDIIKQMRVDLSFLGNRAYRAIVFTDGDKPTVIITGNKTYTNKEQPVLQVLPKGGFVMELQ